MDIYIAPLQVNNYSEVLSNTALILCQSKHAEALQATTSEWLAQGHYVATREGFEHATFRTKGTEPTTEPIHPSNIIIITIEGKCNLP